MFTVSVSHGALKALALVAGTDAVRPMLTGICIDTTTPGRVHLVATDGHRMLIVGNATLEGERIAGKFIVPLFEVKACKQRGTERYPLPVTIDIDTSEVMQARYTIHGKETRSGDLVSSQFPEWQRVIPKRRDYAKPGKIAQFNLTYLAEFGRIAEYLGVKSTHILHNGDTANLIYLGPDAFGVLMPVRSPEKFAPAFVDWLDAPKPEGEPQQIAA